MVVEQSFGSFFFLKHPKKERKDGLRYVYQRITVNGASAELSTSNLWHPSRWDQKNGKAVGTKEDAKTLNAYLDEKRLATISARTELINKNKDSSAIALKGVLTGKSEDNRFILELFRQHNDQMISHLTSTTPNIQRWYAWATTHKRS